jgi:hypothetical protein
MQRKNSSASLSVGMRFAFTAKDAAKKVSEYFVNYMNNDSQ